MGKTGECGIQVQIDRVARKLAIVSVMGTNPQRGLQANPSVARAPGPWRPTRAGAPCYGNAHAVRESSPFALQRIGGTAQEQPEMAAKLARLG